MIRVHGHPPVQKTFSRFTDAKAWAQETELALQRGDYRPGGAEAKKRTLTRGHGQGAQLKDKRYIFRDDDFLQSPLHRIFAIASFLALPDKWDDTVQSFTIT